MDPTKISLFPYNLSSMADEMRPSKKERIELRQRLSHILKEVGDSTPEKCMYCGSLFKGNSRICKSHSIPKRCLKAMTEKGKLLNLNSIIDFTPMPSSNGMANANTFKLICTKCDGMIFREYEDLDNFSENMAETEGSDLHQLMLNQMAMKDYLLLFNEDSSVFRMMGELGKKNFPFVMNSNRLAILEENIEAYRTAYDVTRQRSKRKRINSYRIGYFRIVPYQLPVAFQGAFTPRYDLQGNLINHTFNDNTRLQQLHLAILPSDDISIVIAFRDQKDKRLRELLKNIRALDDKSALKALIALIVTYSDRILFSDKLNQNDINTPYMRELAGDTGSFMTSVEYGEERTNGEWQQELLSSVLEKADHQTQKVESFESIPDVLTEPNC